MTTMQAVTPMPTMTRYSKDEVQVLKAWYQSTQIILTQFIELLEHIGIFSQDVHNTIDIVSHLHIPYCYEHIRMSYQLSFERIHEQLEELKRSMYAFPNEIEHSMDYIKREPTSDTSNEIMTMLEVTLRYYLTRFDVIKHMFYDKKNNAQRYYEESQQLPKPCSVV